MRAGHPARPPAPLARPRRPGAQRPRPRRPARRDRRRGPAQALGGGGGAAARSSPRCAARTIDPPEVGLLLQAAVRLRRSVSRRRGSRGGRRPRGRARWRSSTCCRPDATVLDRRAPTATTCSGSAASASTRPWCSPTARGRWVPTRIVGAGRRRARRGRDRRRRSTEPVRTPRAHGRVRAGEGATTAPRSRISSSSWASTASCRCGPSAAVVRWDGARGREAPGPAAARRPRGRDAVPARPAPGGRTAVRRRPSWPADRGSSSPTRAACAVSRASLPDGDAWVVLVGPEGGFAPGELDGARRPCRGSRSARTCCAR